MDAKMMKTNICKQCGSTFVVEKKDQEKCNECINDNGNDEVKLFNVLKNSNTQPTGDLGKG